MSWLADHWIQTSLLVAYFAMLIHHALAGRKESSSVEGYLVAGRNLGGVVIALSFYATFMSTNTFIGAAGKSWQYGLSWCVGGVVLSGLALLSWTVVAPRFVPLTKQYEALTFADFLGTHSQSNAVRRLAGVIVAFSSILYLIAIYRGASLAIELFLGLPYLWCVLLAAVVVTSYTLVGGFKSVVLTDAVQGFLMLIGAVALFCALLFASGGIDSMMDRLRERSSVLASWTNSEGLAAALAYSIAVGMKYLVEPRQLSRFYGLRDRSALRTAAWIAPLIIFISYACLLPIGAMARTVIDSDTMSTDRVVPYLLGPANLLGPFLGTLFLLVLISAAMSSIDSVLLVAASTMSRDVLSDRSENEVKRVRVWIVVISLTAAGAALLPFAKDIIRMTKFSGSLYAACFLPVFVVGLFLQKRSAKAAILTMLLASASVVATLILRLNKVVAIQEVYAGIVVGLVVFFSISWWRD